MSFDQFTASLLNKSIYLSFEDIALLKQQANIRYITYKTRQTVLIKNIFAVCVCGPVPAVKRVIIDYFTVPFIHLLLTHSSVNCCLSPDAHVTRARPPATSELSPQRERETMINQIF